MPWENCCGTPQPISLLLTATPHKGDPTNFSLFLQLLDADAYADVTSIRTAMQHRQAPFIYAARRPWSISRSSSRMAPGWRRKFLPSASRTPSTFRSMDLRTGYIGTSPPFVKHQSAKAAAQGDDPSATTVGFLAALYQRRLASAPTPCGILWQAAPGGSVMG